MPIIFPMFQYSVVNQHLKGRPLITRTVRRDIATEWLPYNVIPRCLSRVGAGLRKAEARARQAMQYQLFDKPVYFDRVLDEEV